MALDTNDRDCHIVDDSNQRVDLRDNAGTIELPTNDKDANATLTAIDTKLSTGLGVNIPSPQVVTVTNTNINFTSNHTTPIENQVIGFSRTSTEAITLEVFLEDGSDIVMLERLINFKGLYYTLTDKFRIPTSTKVRVQSIGATTGNLKVVHIREVLD